MAARNILHLVDRQCRLWELQHEARQLRTVEPWPVITVSREFGARGEGMARLLGSRIGFEVWDDELVHAIAEEAGANETLLKSLDENRRREIADSIEGALMGGQHMNSEYMRRLLKLFHTLQSHGRSIIVGRGAEYVLAPADVLRVRIVCPLDVRVRGYAERQGLDEDRARQLVRRADRERAAYVRQNFQRDIADASAYDLIVNSGTYTLEAIGDVVLEAYGAKFRRRPPVLGDSSLPAAALGGPP